MESYLLASKIVSMFILGLATWIIGLVPMVAVRRGWISKKESDGNPRLTKILSCMMCFGGGVIMTSSLAHMLPDVKEVLDNSIANGTFPPTSECRLPGLPFHMSSLCQQCRCRRYWCWEGSSSSTAWRSSLTWSSFALAASPPDTGTAMRRSRSLWRRAFRWAAHWECCVFTLYIHIVMYSQPLQLYIYFIFLCVLFIYFILLIVS